MKCWDCGHELYKTIHLEEYEIKSVIYGLNDYNEHYYCSHCEVTVKKKTMALET